LMCETRATMRKENATNPSAGSAVSVDGKRRSQRRPRARGPGPRGGMDHENKGEGNWKMSQESH